MLAIRRDEHGVRAKERHFSPRDGSFRWDYQDQPPELWDLFGARADDRTHIRVHPLLDWTELDVWRYIKQEELPVVDLYFSRGGKRYRSIGCEPCCEPIDSEAATLDGILRELETTRIAERQGRAQDKEAAYAMQQLRALGYM
jgi:sulfate adenylyltransferase subunit 2